MPDQCAVPGLPSLRGDMRGPPYGRRPDGDPARRLEASSRRRLRGDLFTGSRRVASVPAHRPGDASGDMGGARAGDQASRLDAVVRRSGDRAIRLNWTKYGGPRPANRWLLATNRSLVQASADGSGGTSKKQSVQARQGSRTPTSHRSLSIRQDGICGSCPEEWTAYQLKATMPDPSTCGSGTC